MLPLSYGAQRAETVMYCTWQVLLVGQLTAVPAALYKVLFLPRTLVASISSVFVPSRSFSRQATITPSWRLLLSAVSPGAMKMLASPAGKLFLTVSFHVATSNAAC